jgi:hypothetical protein
LAALTEQRAIVLLHLYRHNANVLQEMSLQDVTVGACCAISATVQLYPHKETKLHEVSLHRVKVSLYFNTTATRIIGSFFFSETINSHRNVTPSLTPFFEQLSGRKEG